VVATAVDAAYRYVSSNVRDEAVSREILKTVGALLKKEAHE
jgi:hypothetical protein